MEIKLIFLLLLLSGCIQTPPNDKSAYRSANDTNKPEENYCDYEIIDRDDGATITQYITLPVASDNSSEIGVAISSNEVEQFLTISIRFINTAIEIIDDLHVVLNDNSLITLKLANADLSYINNFQLAHGIYYLTAEDIQKLSASNLKTISVRLEDNLIHTYRCTNNSSIIKEQLDCFYNDINAIKYLSNKYGYQVTISNEYKSAEATQKHIDLKFIKNDGTSILINVSDRLPEEKNITAHDYSKEYIEQSYNQFNADIKVTNAEKIFIDNIDAFLINYTNPRNSTKILEIYFFKGDFAYVLTATTQDTKFSDNEPIFLKAFYSLKFL